MELLIIGVSAILTILLTVIFWSMRSRIVHLSEQRNLLSNEVSTMKTKMHDLKIFVQRMERVISEKDEIIRMGNADNKRLIKELRSAESEKENVQNKANKRISELEDEVSDLWDEKSKLEDDLKQARKNDMPKDPKTGKFTKKKKKSKK